ncbi:MAG TPA: TatD family hydrolase [Edaphocola sp.]|nr:TatD family hydrolase [Edaphocola sp.]
MKFTDSHTHLFAEEFDDDRDAVVARALAAGVDKMYLPNIDTGTVPAMLQMAEKWPANCFPMIGLHPCSVKAGFQRQLDKLAAYFQQQHFWAIGEVGLDFYWDTAFRQEQVSAFQQQIDWALVQDLPVVIHTRNSIDECISIIEKKQNGSLRGVFHCFSGNVEQAQKIIALGFYIGIGGVATFKNGGLAPVLKEIGLKRILLETDSPYLAPVPYRGKRNESSYIPVIAQKIADIKEITLEQVSEVTTRNAAHLFEKI